jgi:Dynein heavy chain, N-terminal region 2
VAALEARISTLSALAERYQLQQRIFGARPSEYPALAVLRHSFEPLAALWRTCGEFLSALPDLMEGPLGHIDPRTLAANMDRWQKGTARIARAVAGDAAEVVVGETWLLMGCAASRPNASCDDFSQPLVVCALLEGGAGSRWLQPPSCTFCLLLPAIRAQLAAFAAHLPLIAAMRNPGLRGRHWSSISQRAQVKRWGLGYVPSPNPKETLNS